MSEYVPLAVGDAILVDAIGAQCVQLHPGNQVGIILDIEGRLNKLQIRDVHRYALSAGMAAELVAEIIVSAHQAAANGSALGITGGHEFGVELEAAIANEQRRRGLTKDDA